MFQTDLALFQIQNRRLTLTIARRLIKANYIVFIMRWHCSLRLALYTAGQYPTGVLII